MKHYTLIVHKPEGDMRARIASEPHFRSPAPNQFVLWDGPAEKRDILNMLEIVRPYCGGLLLACGRGDVQRTLIAEGKF